VTAVDYDVVVIGGGINGVGAAQAVAAAGHSVLVIEKHKLASGTSSKSSKLVHGGLRYLESYEFGLVRESLHERALLLKLAPELVKLQEFCVPLYEETRRSPLLLRTGLSLYYLLSGLDSNARFRSLPRSRWGALDGLRTDGLKSVFVYTDARTDDALLTHAVMRSASSLGAELICPATFTGARLHDKGCSVDYRVGDQQHTVSARVLINAAGPWVSETDRLISPAISAVPVELVQGAHIVLPGDLEGFSPRYFYYVESVRDGRAIFVMPRDAHLVVGTTETRYREDPDHVRPLPGEELYLLGVLGHYFPALRNLGRSDLVASWAGLRVLPGGQGHAFHRSRETILHTDRSERPRVLTIYGGKLTSYRATAEKVVEKLEHSLPERPARASTRELPLTAG
jgi:glycerol-3-phosphate dehydrogenase